MDIQTGLIYVGVVVISAAVILMVSLFGIKEKSYEEAIAEQRKLPDDLLLAKKEKGKEKKHKSKTGKKVKEKKEEKDEKDEKPEHVQFEETPHILAPEGNIQEACRGNKKKNKPDKVKPILVNKDESPIIVSEPIASQSPLTEVNHFDVMHPKDEVELIRSQSIGQPESVMNKSPKETPTKSKRNVAKEPVKKKEEIKEEKKTEINMKELNMTAPPTPPTPPAAKEPSKELKEPQKDGQKDAPVVLQPSTNKESKKNKKKNDILAQIGGDKDGINVSLLMPLVQKAELSRSEIQILIDQLLNKQLDNPMEHSEWTEGRADPVIKLKKQLAEKDKALAEEHEASVTFQNKLKELRAELNSERSRLTSSVKQLEEALNVKITEAQTLHTRMQHILESHAAEKQGFARQIEQLQSKVSEDSAIIHKMQEDQGQTQGHLQQELIAQRKQLEVQFSQMRENENALKSQLAQKHVEIQELQNVNMNMTQELQATCESSTGEIEMLRQQLVMLQEQYMHSEGQLQHLKEASDRLQDMARQLDEAHRGQADLEHRLKNAHRHEQELQKQLHSLQAELKMFEVEANNASTLKSELNKLQNEFMKFEFEAEEVNKLRSALNSKEEEIEKMKTEFSQAQAVVHKTTAEMNNLELTLNEKSHELNKMYSETAKLHEDLKQARSELLKTQRELGVVREELSKTAVYAKTANESSSELKLVKAELEKLRNGDKISSADQIQMTKLQEENDRLSLYVSKNAELQKELKRLRDENESLASQLASITDRSATEGRKNGIEQKFEKNSVQYSQYADLSTEQKKQLETLKDELLKNQTELNKLNSTIEISQRDMDNKNSLIKRLQDDLELQRSKNNANINQIKNSEQEFTKSLLQRIFPEIQIAEMSYDRWIKAFEQSVRDTLMQKSENKNTHESNLEVEKQNKNLQGLVSHYKQIIVDTEAMLNNLQNHVESEESRWQSKLRQQENELINLRLDLKELQNNKQSTDNLHEKILQLESRMKEEKELRELAESELKAFKASSKLPSKNGTFNFGEVEQLQEQKLRLLQDLETESSKVSTLKAELNKLQQLRTATCAASGSSGRALNGPKLADPPKNDEPTRTSQSLIAAIEKTLLQNAAPDNPQRDNDYGSFTSELNPENCHTTAHDTQSNWNPMNSQLQKKHKRKRKVKQ